MGRMIKAQLVYDSSRTREHLGARRTMVADRTLLFRAGDLHVDLMVDEQSEQLRILQGQAVFATSGAPLVEVPVRCGADRTDTDAFGQFALTGVEPRAQVLIRAPDGDIVLSLPEAEERPC